MKAVDNLIIGMPQRIEEGAILLGLAAWHIYPDLYVLGSLSRTIPQNDHLVAEGGVVTLGLRNTSTTKDEGIYWSLPLVYLKYYGNPIISTSTTGAYASRISFDQLLQTAIGSLISSWGHLGLDLSGPLQLIVNLFTHLSSKRPECCAVDKAPNKQANAKKRKSSRATKASASVDNRPEKLSEEPYSLLSTGQELILSTAKQYLDASKEDQTIQRRLIHFGQRRCPDFLAPRELHSPPAFGLTDMRVLLSLFHTLEGKVECLRENIHSFSNDLDNLVVRCYDGLYFKPKYTAITENKLRPAKRNTRGPGLFWFEEDEQYNNEKYTGAESIDWDSGQIAFSIFCRTRMNDEPTPHEFICGDPETAAVFRKITPDQKPTTTTNITQLPYLQLSLNSCYLEHILLKERLAELFSPKGRILNRQLASLDTLAMASQIYATLPGSAIDLRVTSRPLQEWKWWSELDEDHDPSLGHTFACIACLETGHLDLQPKELQSVMAITYKNSIYVSQKMLSDPITQLPQYATQRLVGNIGKPGLSLLVPPTEPRVQEPAYDTWNLVNHDSFDGKLEDNFAGTSLHLSFSDYSLPIGLGTSGQRYQEAQFVEAIISVYDRGTWVADLDIIKASKEWELALEPHSEKAGM